jgi:uncharacterized membrane protein YkvA (DUF1232 family)
MNVSSTTVKLTSKDLIEIVKEYIKVEGLKIENLEIDELINIYGSYKKGLKIPFRLTVGLGNIKNNEVCVKIFNFKIAKIGITSSVKRFALKNLLKDFEKNGIIVKKDNLYIDLNLILKFIPFFYFKLNNINLLKNAIEIEISDIIYEPSKETSKFDLKKEKNQYKAYDTYNKIRNNLKNKVDYKYKDILEYALIIPDITVLLWRLFKDKRVDAKTKILVGSLIGYISSPIDILPDFIPFIGKIDDVAIIFFAMNKIINEIPEEIILSNWSGKENIIKIIKEGVSFISNMVGAQNVARLLKYIKKLSKAKSGEKVNEKSRNIY